MTRDLKASEQLLGGYLHQDWPDEFDSPDAAIDAMVDGEPEEVRHRAAAELGQLISQEHDDAELRRQLVDQVGCFYDPASDALTYRQWLTKLADRLAQ